MIASTVSWPYHQLTNPQSWRHHLLSSTTSTSAVTCMLGPVGAQPLVCLCHARSEAVLPCRWLRPAQRSMGKQGASTSPRGALHSEGQLAGSGHVRPQPHLQCVLGQTQGPHQQVGRPHSSDATIAIAISLACPPTPGPPGHRRGWGLLSASPISLIVVTVCGALLSSCSRSPAV
jgi:hypothetical protein